MKYRTLALVLALATTASAEPAVNSLTESERRSGWELLFDGDSTEHWRNYKKESLSDGWQVINGAITRVAKGAGDIVTKKQYDAFELSLEYQISKAGNSGVMFHVQENSNSPWHTGPEIQVQDNVDGHDPQKAGWLYQLYQPGRDQNGNVIDATRPAGEWNQLYIRINGNDCEVCMNGVRYYHFKLGDKNWEQKVSASKFTKFENFGSSGSGHICLQDHGDKVAYRNIKVREFNEDGSVPQPIDGKLDLSANVAFPNLKWDEWEPVNDAGQLRALRLMELTPARDGSNRLFAASQYGAIWCFENREDVEESHLVLDLREQVKDWKNRGANEQGLLGLALHPEFKRNGHLFVYYSHPTEPKSVVARYTISKDNAHRVDPGSSKIIMEIDQPYQNHNGGVIEFGPDGYLYIALGDGGFRNDPTASGQDLDSLLGSILRIDIDATHDNHAYGIPADNPFVNHKGARPEIYAYGLRNPWRMAFDSQSGRLWVGDVGQELWEEVNVITKGGNYGWSTREGSHPFGNRPTVEGLSDPIEPVFEYDHRIGKSITGGRVYQSDRVGELTGKYLYADYVTGKIWALSYDADSGKATRNEQVIPDSIPVVAFGEDQNGEVFYLTESSRGQCIYRFNKQ
ncbi:MAG: PQQ-dependent sugar dehydrogenase [Rubripirellula sp.]